MKTTLDITDELLLRAKQVALERDMTLRALVEEALERAIGGARGRWPPLETVTYGEPTRRAPEPDFAAWQREANPDTDDAGYLAKRLGVSRVPPPRKSRAPRSE